MSELEQMQARARQLVGDVSHELPTPLTAMTAEVDVVHEHPAITGSRGGGPLRPAAPPRAAASRARARLIAGRKLVPLPPDPLPDKLYMVIDGTGVPMTGRETAGRQGKGEDGRARTREVKMAVFFTQDTVDDERYPVRDRPPPATSPPSSPPARSSAW